MATAAGTSTVAVVMRQSSRSSGTHRLCSGLAHGLCGWAHHHAIRAFALNAECTLAFTTLDTIVVVHQMTATLFRLSLFMASVVTYPLEPNLWKLHLAEIFYLL